MLAAWLAIAVQAGPAQAADFSKTRDATYRVGATAFDLIVLRPLNAAALAVGTMFFVASVPFVAPFEGIRPAWSSFVYAPYEYTVLRPLGEF